MQYDTWYIGRVSAYVRKTLSPITSSKQTTARHFAILYLYEKKDKCMKEEQCTPSWFSVQAEGF